MATAAAAAAAAWRACRRRVNVRGRKAESSEVAAVALVDARVATRKSAGRRRERRRASGASSVNEERGEMDRPRAEAHPI
mmetsp:Transcript_11260/g.27470  ORF Transcript_11260/g.27470 Transcript_11260/m.27470 type:complete len:80 (-) Transcript_11260:4-243(-)